VATPTLLQSDYARGTVRDLARHNLPKNATWKLTDYIPNLGAPLRKRGGSAYASPVLGGSAHTYGVAFAPFAAGNQLIGIDDAGHVWKIDNVGSATDKGASRTGQPLQRPVFFQEKLIMPDPAGAAAPYKYDGSAAPALLTGTPPNARYAEAYKSRLLLAGTAAQPNYVYFSDILDPQSWDLVNSYIPVTQPIQGIAALRNMVMVFSDGLTERIRGDNPPPGGDMVREPIFNEGCIDARSIVTLGERVIWANGNGVWISDGAAADNLIEQGGLLKYWASMLTGYSSSTWTISAGLLHGYYIITIMNGTSFVDSLMIHIESKTWSFLSNLKATMFAEAYGTTPELYFSTFGAKKIGALSGIFTPSSANQADADGTDVQPVIETVYYRGAPGSRRFKDFIIGNHIEVVGGSTTYLKTSVITSPEDTTYDILCLDDGTTPIQIVPSGAFQRSKVAARRASEGIGLKIEQIGGSYDTMLFDIETTQHDREGLR